MRGELPDDLQRTAEQQAGALSRRQLLEAGIRDSAIKAGIRAGRWQRIHRGVILTHTGVAAFDTRIWAALLYAGPGAVASHSTAAELWGLLDPSIGAPARARDRSGVVHVSVPLSRRVMPQPGVVLHLSGRLPGDAHPARSPARTRLEPTVLDMVEDASSIVDVVGWITVVLRVRRTTPHRLAEAIAERPRMHWHRELTLMLSDVDRGVRSPLEWHYLHRVERAHRLPIADRQHHRFVDGQSEWLDMAYDPYRLIVELDGRLGHEADPFRDRRRDNWSTVGGLDTLRYGWVEVLGDTCEVAREVAQILRRNGWRGAATPCREGCPLAEAA